MDVLHDSDAELDTLLERVKTQPDPKLRDALLKLLLHSTQGMLPPLRRRYGGMLAKLCKLNRVLQTCGSFLPSLTTLKAIEDLEDSALRELLRQGRCNLVCAIGKLLSRKSNPCTSFLSSFEGKYWTCFPASHEEKCNCLHFDMESMPLKPTMEVKKNLEGQLAECDLIKSRNRYLAYIFPVWRQPHSSARSPTMEMVEKSLIEPRLKSHDLVERSGGKHERVVFSLFLESARTLED